jgi:death on curing protein
VIRLENVVAVPLETPLQTFDGNPCYGSLAEMAATYAWGIVRNHPFVDGNKRTAFLTALTFLEINGRPIRVGLEWVEIMVRAASDPEFTRRHLVEAFRGALGTDEPVI